MGRPCLQLEAGCAARGLDRSAAATFSFAPFVSGNMGRPGGLPSCQEEAGAGGILHRRGARRELSVVDAPASAAASYPPLVPLPPWTFETGTKGLWIPWWLGVGLAVTLRVAKCVLLWCPKCYFCDCLLEMP